MNNGHSCVLAVDAGGTSLKAALVRPDCTIMKDTFFKVPVQSDGSLERIKESYINLASSGVRKASERGLEVAGIGVCIPGPFDYGNGICLMTHKYTSIYGISIRPWLQEGAGKLAVRFIHDSSAFILGAVSSGRYKKFSRICAVIIGTGLGFAAMTDSKVLSNPQGGPGISIFKQPYRDSTAEEYVSRRGIISHYSRLCPGSAGGIDVIDIDALARSGQPEAELVFKNVGIYLSEILYDIIYENKFECLLLGGAISKGSDLFITSLRQGLAGIPFLALIEQVEDIDGAPLLGAAYIANGNL